MSNLTAMLIMDFISGIIPQQSLKQLAAGGLFQALLSKMRIAGNLTKQWVKTPALASGA
jgi:hypothetical protein